MIAAFFATLLGGIKTTLMLGLIGAAVGVCSMAIGRLIGGLQGYGAAAVLGAVVLVGAYGSAAFDGARARQAEAKIAQLNFEKAKLAQGLAAQVAAASTQDEIQAKQAAQIEDDRAKLAKLGEIIQVHKGDTSKCVYPDELNHIFR